MSSLRVLGIIRTTPCQKAGVKPCVFDSAIIFRPAPLPFTGLQFLFYSNKIGFFLGKLKKPLNHVGAVEM